MTLEEFVAILSDEYATAEFEYNGKRCGIEPETSDSNTTCGSSRLFLISRTLA